MPKKPRLKNDAEVVVRYSETERNVFSKLPVGKPATSSTIIDKIDAGHGQSYHFRNVFNAIIRSLIKKMKENSEPWEIERSKRQGPHPMTIKVVTRKRT